MIRMHPSSPRSEEESRMPWMGAEGWRVDPSPAAKKELEQKSIKGKKKKERKKLEAGCKAERGIWLLWSQEPAPHRRTLCYFPPLRVEKAICGSGKRALNLPKAVTHRPAEVPLQRGAPAGHRRPALATSAKKASEEEEKTTLQKKPLAAPKQPVSLH